MKSAVLTFTLFLATLDLVTSVFLEETDGYRHHHHHHKKKKHSYYGSDSDSGSHEYNGGGGGDDPTAPPTPPPPPAVGPDGCPIITGSMSCDPGWTPFSRVKGVRCLKIFAADQITEPAAEALCAQQNAILAGVENDAERQWINAEFLTVRPDNTDTHTIWVGAKRKPECMYLPYAATCFPKETQQFNWIDPCIVGTDGFGPWWPGEPNNGNQVTILQPCIQFTILRSLGKFGTSPGSMDDVECQGFKDYIIGYVCSKVPTSSNWQG